ncbi:MAG: hypothetical protein Q9197_003328 [Variospora fuerteventurae]
MDVIKTAQDSGFIARAEAGELIKKHVESQIDGGQSARDRQEDLKNKEMPTLPLRAISSGGMTEKAVEEKGKGKLIEEVRRIVKRKSEPQTENQAIALHTIMEKEYPQPAHALAARRKYEINLYLLFRLYGHKRCHGLIPQEMDARTQASYDQLAHFTISMRFPAGYDDDLFQGGGEEEGYLTELAVYWRSSRPNHVDEMMKYMAIWEHVAQRPLAWEGKVVAHGLPDDEEHRLKRRGWPY